MHVPRTGHESMEEILWKPLIKNNQICLIVYNYVSFDEGLLPLRIPILEKERLLCDARILSSQIPTPQTGTFNKQIKIVVLGINWHLKSKAYLEGGGKFPQSVK